jgi:hypothetical protein
MFKTVRGTLVAGHGVASGQSRADRRFPGGTIRLQEEFFRERGLDLDAYFPRGFVRGTLNIRLPTGVVAIKRPDFVFRAVKWTPLFPPENFFLSGCTVSHDARNFRGLFYIPDPQTKPDHFQDRRVVEVIAESISAIAIGDTVTLAFDSDAVDIE